jgi:energy-coupling factor transport system permease protein
LGIALLTLVSALKLARVPLKYALRGLLPPLPFILFLALLQIFLGIQGNATVPLASTNVGLELLGLPPWLWSRILDALTLLMRFAALILGISLISFCISTTELIHGLTSLLTPLTRLGLPTHDFVLMIQVALHFLPLLAREAEHIAKAQASRGAEWGVKQRQGLGRGLLNLFKRVRHALPLLVPLFLTALRRAENLALAMEARGYSAAKRTSIVTLRFQGADGIALSLTLGISLLILFFP